MFTGSEKMFAIDGQHRVEAIKLAYEKDPKRIGEDQYPVIFVAHLDTRDGKVRTRRLFCDINKNAVAVSEGDKVVIDEDDLSAIVARRVYATYPLFKQGSEIAVTERKEVLVEGGVERFTSLLAIYTVCRKLKRLYRRPRGTLENEPQNVNAFQQIVFTFFDFIVEHERSLNRYFRKGSTTLRKEREKNQNLFFRPIGLEVLARLYAHFVREDRLKTLEYGLDTLQFKNPDGVFDGVLWNRGRVEASAKAKAAAVGLCLYLMRQLTTKEEAELTDKLREVRKDPNYSLPEKPPRPPA